MTADRTATTIEDALNAPLDPKHVTHRTKSGTQLDYLEGWHVIAEANRIFGPLNWSRETVYCKQVSADKNAKGNHVIGYEAKVRITVHIDGREVVREGTGTGSGIASSIYDAIEGANKEAETDAMKRALMTFGWCMGLALYDKGREHVEKPKAKAKADRAPVQVSTFEAKGSPAPEPEPEASEELLNLQDQLAEAKDEDELTAIRTAWVGWVSTEASEEERRVARSSIALRAQELGITLKPLQVSTLRAG